MAGNGGLFCLGCGENLVGKKPYERRVLYTLQGKKVKDSWKELLTSTGTVSVVAEIDLSIKLWQNYVVSWWKRLKEL